MKSLRYIVVGLLLVFELSISSVQSQDKESKEPCIPVVEKTVTGKVVSVKDGDTISMLIDQTLTSVRFEGIDAPEKGQDHSAKATEALTDWVKGKDAKLEITGKDRYGRTLGIVWVDGKNINTRLIENGWAWQYEKYNCDPTLKKLEAAAKQAKLGLWQHPSPVPPWEYRRLLEERKQIARERAESPSTPAPIVSPQPKEPTPAPARQYWLNTSSNVRHNSSCQHFGSTKKGSSCGPNEGKACGICGG